MRPRGPQRGGRDTALRKEIIERFVSSWGLQETVGGSWFLIVLTSEGRRVKAGTPKSDGRKGEAMWGQNVGGRGNSYLNCLLGSCLDGKRQECG